MCLHVSICSYVCSVIIKYYAEAKHHQGITTLVLLIVLLLCDASSWVLIVFRKLCSINCFHTVAQQQLRWMLFPLHGNNAFYNCFKFVFSIYRTDNIYTDCMETQIKLFQAVEHFMPQWAEPQRHTVVCLFVWVSFHRYQHFMSLAKRWYEQCTTLAQPWIEMWSIQQ